MSNFAHYPWAAQTDKPHRRHDKRAMCTEVTDVEDGLEVERLKGSTNAAAAASTTAGW